MTIEVPGHGVFDIRYAVCDFNGTIAIDGQLLDGVADQFNGLIERGIHIHVITADTHGTAVDQLRHLACKVHILASRQHDAEKDALVRELGADHVAAFGNGYNDHMMLQSARLGIAVMQQEGLAVKTMTSADVVVSSIHDGLDLLLHPSRLIATLRY